MEPEPLRAGTEGAAWAAIDNVMTKLREDGYDDDSVWLVVMVLIPSGRVVDSSIAAHLPDATPRRLLDHVVQQLEPVARECGVRIVLQGEMN